MINPFHELDAHSHFRLIPEIDKMRTVVSFATSVAGRLILSVIFALFFFIPGKFDLILFAGILFLGATRIRKSLKLLIFCFWAPFSHFHSDVPRGWGLLPRPDFLSGFQQLPTRGLIDPTILGQLICRLLVLLLLLFMFALSRKTKKFNGLVLPVMIWSVLAALALYSSWGPLARAFSWNLEAYFGASIFAFMYAQIARESPANKGTSWADLSMGMHNLGVGGILPMVRQQKDLEECDSRALAVCQLKALKLLTWSVMLDVLRESMERFFFSAPTRYPQLLAHLPGLGWPNYAAIGISSFLDYHLPVWKIWAILLAQIFLYILELGAFTGFAIALLRLAGVYAPRNVFRPYLGRTFNAYFRRILFFYSEILIHFFFFPAWKLLRSYVANKKLCMIMALFYAVFWGGLLFHITREMSAFYYFEQGNPLEYFLSHAPYFALIALITCVSAWGVVPRLIPFRVPGVLSTAGIIVVHAVLMTLTCVNPNNTFELHLRFLRVLFAGH